MSGSPAVPIPFGSYVPVIGPAIDSFQMTMSQKKLYSQYNYCIGGMGIAYMFVFLIYLIMMANSYSTYPALYKKKSKLKVALYILFGCFVDFAFLHCIYNCNLIGAILRAIAATIVVAVVVSDVYDAQVQIYARSEAGVRTKS